MPVSQTSGTSGKYFRCRGFSGWLYSCVLMDIARNAEEYTAGPVLLKSCERFPFPEVVLSRVFERKGMSFCP